jgi:hypothetical protein
LTSAYGGLKKDFDDVRSSYDTVVKEKTQLQKTERTKAQRFRDALRKKLALLRRDTEASVTALRGRCAEFPANASVSDLLENITCYALIGVFQMLVKEGCEHIPELKELTLTCDASILQEFPKDVSEIAKMLVKNWWTKHGLPYCMQKIEEENWVRSTALLFGG